MRQICLTLVTLLIFSLTLWGQNTGVDYVNQLKKNNPLFSGFKGEFSVSDNGAATYNIPFLVTPGVAGMTPQLSVSYNSNNTTSILGEGWSLNGLSLISRIGNVNAIDGYSQPVIFDETDNIQLDGQRLIPIHDNHGVNGATYYTENNTFKRITISKTNGNTIDGVQYFRVQSKDGIEYYYGNLESSDLISMGMQKLSSIIGGTGLKGIVTTKAQREANIPFLWLVTLIKDKNGNWIYFKYNMQENFYSPEEIFYGGNNLPAIGRIKFSYDIKDHQKKTAVGQPNPWNWTSTKYLRGEVITINKPLAKVSSYYKNGEKENVVREYYLDYDLDKVSNKLILTKLFQSTVGHLDKNNATTHKKVMSDKDNAIIFDWYKAQNRTTFSNAFITKEDLLFDEDFKITIADFNGDGFPDKFLYKNFEDKIIYLLSVNDKKGNFISNALTDTIKTKISKKAKTFTGDFNADGVNDMVYLSNENDKLQVYIYYSKINQKKDFLGFTELIKSNITDIPKIDFKDVSFGIGDINSDGFTDILLYYIDNNKLNYQSLIFTKDIAVSNKSVQDKGNIPSKNYISQFNDINGDGISDLIFTWTTEKGWYIRSFTFPSSNNFTLTKSIETKGDVSLYVSPIGLKLPDGISYADLIRKLETGELTKAGLDSLIERGTNQTISEGDYSKLGNVMFADINKDGNTDLLISNTDIDGWVYYYAFGKGDGTFNVSKKQTITSRVKFLFNHRSSFGDFNGDGVLDLIIQKSDSKGWHQLIAYGDSNGNFTLQKGDANFETLSPIDYSYSQQFVTDFVMPYCASNIFGLRRIFDDGRIKKIVDCDINSHECFMKNIRQIFPVETGFYPKEERPYQSQMIDPLKNFIPQNLNFDKNIKRIIEAGYWGDSTITACSSGGFCFCSGNHKYYTKLTFGDYWQPYVIDLNGDGISDLLLTYPRQVPNDTILKIKENELEKASFSFTVINLSKKTGLLKEILHSYKSKIVIEYKSVTNSDKNHFNSSDLKYPYIQCHAPIYTIAKIGTTNGISRDSLQYYQICCVYNSLLN